MTSEIDKLKHFHVENYSGTNFTDDLNDGEEFLKSKLDGYRKAYTVLNLEAESCKKEEQRLAVLRKTKENNAERLEGVMLDAVIAYGDLGKSGNKVINLVDSKLYTKNSKCVEIDENLNQIFIDLVLEHLQSL